MVLIHGALHQEGVLGVNHPRDALLCAFHKHAGLLGFHVVPHPLVGLIARVLQKSRQNAGDETLTADVQAFEAQIKWRLLKSGGV